MVVSAQNIDQYDQGFSSFKDNKKKRKQPQTMLEAPPPSMAQSSSHTAPSDNMSSAESIALNQHKARVMAGSKQHVDKSIKRIYENYRTNMRLRPKLDMLLGDRFFKSTPKHSDQYKSKVEEIRAALGRGNAGIIAKGLAVTVATVAENIPTKAFPAHMGRVDLSNFGEVMKHTVEDEDNDEVQDLFEEIDCEYNEYVQMGLHSRIGSMFLKTAYAVNRMNISMAAARMAGPQVPVPAPPPEMQAKYAHTQQVPAAKKPRTKKSKE